MNVGAGNQLQLAVASLRAGRVDEVERICRQVLAIDPSDADALHLLGVALHRLQQPQLAIEHISRAIAQDPSRAAFRNNLGGILREQGRPAEAIECFRVAVRLQPNLLQAQANLGNALLADGQINEAIEVFLSALVLEPTFVEGHYFLANALARAGRPDEAAASYLNALRLKPGFGEAALGLGNVFKSRGQFEEAIQALERAVAVRPDFAAAHFALGDLLRLQGRMSDAVESLQSAVRFDPSSLSAQNELGNTLRDANRLEEAAQVYERALQSDRTCVQLLVNLGNVYQELGRTADAMGCHREALRIRPDFGPAHNALGASLQRQGNRAAAERCFRKAVEIDPRCETSLHNLATALLQSGDLPAANVAFENVLRIHPDHAEARYWRGTIRLSLGDFSGGWQDYECRRKTKFASRDYPQQLWQGEELKGRTILIHPEWGLGDTLQFARYVPLVQERGGDVVFMVQSALIPLLQQSGFPNLISTDAEPPPCTVQVPILSLPRIFGTTPDSIPAPIPYLAPRCELVERWREKLRSYPGFKIGIHWHGSRPSVFDARSIPLREFEPLARVHNTTLISLQKGPGAEQIDQVQNRFEIVRFDDELDKSHGGAFMDTTAIMSEIDLVVTNDTAVAHLAGALGVPVWNVLNYAAAWMWQVNREDSPWYPTMRLFRQTRLDDWSGVFEQMADELRRLNP